MKSIDEVAKKQDEILEQSKSSSIDDCVIILQKTVFHIWGCWVFALYCIVRDFGGMLGFNLDSVELAYDCKLAIGYALVIELFHLLAFINQLVLSKGLPKNSLSKDKTIVITGGSSGLGEKLAGILGIQGYKVVNLDIFKPRAIIPNVEFIECDVTNLKSVEAAAEQIEGDVNVLINNAGLITSKSTILETNLGEVENTFKVNVYSHYNTTQVFVSKMISKKIKGHVVTISSILGSMGPSKASAYAASKAAVNNFHDSLTHEMSSLSYEIKTLLVTPGQLDSSMFHGVKTPSNFLAPVVNIDELAQQIVKCLENGKCGVLSMPFYTTMVKYLKILPMGVQELLRSAIGMDKAMDTFVGDN